MDGPEACRPVAGAGVSGPELIAGVEVSRIIPDLGRLAIADVHDLGNQVSDGTDRLTVPYKRRISARMNDRRYAHGVFDGAAAKPTLEATVPPKRAPLQSKLVLRGPGRAVPQSGQRD